MSHTTFTQKWVAGGAALLLGAGISLAAVPGAMAVTQYAGPQTCPSGQYAAIQSMDDGHCQSQDLDWLRRYRPQVPRVSGDPVICIPRN